MPDNHDDLLDKNIYLVTFQDVFNNPTIYITENGFAQVGRLQIEDVERCKFYKSTILEVAKGSIDNCSAVKKTFFKPVKKKVNWRSLVKLWLSNMEIMFQSKSCTDFSSIPQ